MSALASVINVTGTFKDWVNTGIDTVAATLTAPNAEVVGYPLGKSWQKDEDASYPMMYGRFEAAEKFSPRRNQYYAVCKIHLLFPESDEWNLAKACTGFMNYMGVGETASEQIVMLQLTAIDRLTQQDFATGNLSAPPLGINIEVRTEDGWIVEDMDKSLRSNVPDDKFRQASRIFYIYY